MVMSGGWSNMSSHAGAGTLWFLSSSVKKSWSYCLLHLPVRETLYHELVALLAAWFRKQDWEHEATSLVFDLRSGMEPPFLVSGGGAVTVSSRDLLVMMQFLSPHEELASMTSDLTQGIRISPTGSTPEARLQARCHP